MCYICVRLKWLHTVLCSPERLAVPCTFPTAQSYSCKKQFAKQGLYMNDSEWPIYMLLPTLLLPLVSYYCCSALVMSTHSWLYPCQNAFSLRFFQDDSSVTMTTRNHQTWEHFFSMTPLLIHVVQQKAETPTPPPQIPLHHTIWTELMGNCIWIKRAEASWLWPAFC